jgi:hypothetical protein
LLLRDGYGKIPHKWANIPPEYRDSTPKLENPKMGENKKTEILAKCTLLLTSLIWGAGFILSQFALDAGFGPAGLMLGKFGIATVLCGIIYRKPIARSFKAKHLKRGIPIGLILVASFFAQTVGLQYGYCAFSILDISQLLGLNGDCSN